MFSLTIIALAGVTLAQEMPFMTERPEDQDAALDAWLGPEVNSIVKCQTCGTIVRRLSSRLAEEATQALLVNVATDVCMALPGVMNKETVCPAVVPMFAAPIWKTLDDQILTKLRICDEFLGFC